LANNNFATVRNKHTTCTTSFKLVKTIPTAKQEQRQCELPQTCPVAFLTPAKKEPTQGLRGMSTQTLLFDVFAEFG